MLNIQSSSQWSNDQSSKPLDDSETYEIEKETEKIPRKRLVKSSKRSKADSTLKKQKLIVSAFLDTEALVR